MYHADYDIVRVEHDRVFIIDLDLGNKSVTNDAEHVYSELQKLWPGKRVIYRDTLGQWDEIVKCYHNNTSYYHAEFQHYTEHKPNITFNSK